jgi:hypothetical protein
MYPVVWSLWSTAVSALFTPSCSDMVTFILGSFGRESLRLYLAMTSASRSVGSYSLARGGGDKNCSH